MRSATPAGSPQCGAPQSGHALHGRQWALLAFLNSPCPTQRSVWPGSEAAGQQRSPQTSSKPDRPACQTWRSIPAPTPLQAAVTASGKLIVAYRNQTGTSSSMVWNGASSATAMEWDGASWAALGRPFFAGTYYSEGLLNNVRGIYGSEVGLTVVGESPYVNFQQARPWGQVSPEMTLTLDRATGDWQAMGGGPAGDGSCSDFTFHNLGATPTKLCSLFYGEPVGIDDCGLSVVCFGV